MATRTPRQLSPRDTSLERLRRRTWPLVATVVFVSLGTAYVFRWGSVEQGHPYAWVAPDDLWATFAAAVSFTHGHFGAIYQGQKGFLAYPGILILLVPLAALSGSLNTTLLEVGKNHHLFRHPQVLLIHGSPNLQSRVLTSGANQYLAHPQVLLLLAPYTLLLSCSVLFAGDALAERLGVDWRRRALLALAEAVVLWNVAVFWGHPEDAISVALIVYAVIFGLDDRWVGAGWLLGAAVAMQPLVIVIVPLLLVLSGRRRPLALVLRGVIPAVVITVPSLAANFHATVHTLVEQPAYPRLPANHRTPWTVLAPTLGGRGADTTIGGGPLRVIALGVAVLLGWWARRWRNRPEMLVWAMAAALALRCYTESVMTPYYVWPALAVGLVVAARGSNRRFGLAIVVAVMATIVAQWHLGEWPWWLSIVVGLTAMLIVCAVPEPSPATGSTGDTTRERPPGPKADATRSAQKSNPKSNQKS